MKKYARSKTPEELAAACAKAGAIIDTTEYDKGGDWITIAGNFADQYRRFIVSTFNGNFICKMGDEMVTERSTQYDNEDWYAAIMDLIYVPAEKDAAE